jgi:predicted metal-dependent hydrolase
MSTPADVEIVRRRVRLDFPEAAAASWSADARSIEDGLNAISFLLPTGEVFFVHSVARYVDRISDPALKEQAARFIHQEAMHSREHERSNAVLRRANAFGSEMERAAKLLLGLARIFLPPSTRLGVTCALEHFTAILADSLLTRRPLHAEATNPGFAGLWYWHAAEELEHKAVCFDVYEHVFGRGFWAWLHRCFAMVLVLGFGAVGLAVAFAVVRLKLARRRGAAAQSTAATPELDESGPSLRKLFRAVHLGAVTEYFSRRFHPWNHDNRHLLAAWKAENPGFGMPQAGEKHASA